MMSVPYATAHDGWLFKLTFLVGCKMVTEEAWIARVTVATSGKQSAENLRRYPCSYEPSVHLLEHSLRSQSV